jgi:glycine oxidase
MGVSGSAGTGGGARVAVIGAGVIGLSCALELRRRGAAVGVYEAGPDVGRGASTRAAGMLGVSFEAAQDGEDPLFRLAQLSLDLWDGYARRVEGDGVGTIGYSRTGALACAMSTADEARLNRLAEACLGRGLPAERLSGHEARALEPALTDSVRMAVRLPQDRQVDAQLLTQVLARAVSAAGGQVMFGVDVGQVAVGEGFALGDGRVWDCVVVATGVGRAPQFVRKGDALASGLPDILPVKGQMLALAPYADGPQHVIRLGDAYVAPKGRWILVGATSEPGRADVTVETAALDRLRLAAAGAVRGVDTALQAAAWAGLRPATPDGLPVIGASAIPGVFAALGHFRNGILLAPGTAERVADLVLDGKVSEDAAAFAASRFDNRVTAPHSRSANA